MNKGQLVRKLLFVFLLLLSTITLPGRWLDAQESPAAYTTATVLNLRAGPGIDHAIVARLRYHTRVLLEGRSPGGNWFWVSVPDQESVRGWVTVFYLQFDSDLNVMDLPVTTEPAQPVATAPTSGGSRIPAPILSPAVAEHVRQVMQRGQQLGIQANFFTVLGDCHTANWYFMAPFGTGSYELGPYAHLQVSIDYFRSAFLHRSVATATGFNAYAVLDPAFADPVHCQPGESPLACEYRRAQPGIAVIMLSAPDWSPDYTHAMRQVVQESVERGVVPVLTTYPGLTWGPFNEALVNIAQEQRVPLLDFWRASRVLPNYGLQDDNFHLTGTKHWVSFKGDEQILASTLRNLITLQMLDVIRESWVGNG